MLEVIGYIDGDAIKGTIDIGRIKGRSGKIPCPICPSQGKQHIKDRCLSVNLDKEVFNCHKCGWVGGWTSKFEEKKFIVPDVSNQTELKLEHLQMFSKRMITQPVLCRNRVRTAINKKNNNRDWVAFTYFDGDQPVKVKYKKKMPDGSKKIFQIADCKPWIYKYNDLVGQKEVMVCEGEEEALIWEVAGYKNACSVDAGAPNEKDKNVDAKLQCITNCFHVFESAEVIYLALDSDPNGKRLQRELVKRFGAEKCKIIDFSPFKDANDYALSNGIEKLIELKESAVSVPIEGFMFCHESFDEMLYNYENGQLLGTTTYFDELDPHWTWRLGEVNVWTGYNNEGKSLFLRQLQLAKSMKESWKHAVFCPEEYPASEWYTDIIESYIGKSAEITQVNYNNYMTKEEFKEGLYFVNDHFINIYPPINHGIEALLKLFSYAIRKYGVKTITLDPYNQIHHKMSIGEREDLYISRFMAMLKKFAIDHMVCINLVAHQRTPIVAEGKNFPKPNLFLIKGGGTFADKADNVIAVWRENRNTDPFCNQVKIISQKIKKQKLTGRPGTCTFYYDRQANQYYNGLGYYYLLKIREEMLFQKSKGGIQTDINFLNSRELIF